MPMFVSAGSISTQATSPCESASSTEPRSLNSATRVVSAGSTIGPTLPSRARSRPPASSVTKASSTLPW